MKTAKKRLTVIFAADYKVGREIVCCEIDCTPCGSPFPRCPTKVATEARCEYGKEEKCFASGFYNVSRLGRGLIVPSQPADFRRGNGANRDAAE